MEFEGNSVFTVCVIDISVDVVVFLNYVVRSGS